MSVEQKIAAFMNRGVPRRTLVVDVPKGVAATGVVALAAGADVFAAGCSSDNSKPRERSDFHPERFGPIGRASNVLIDATDGVSRPDNNSFEGRGALVKLPDGRIVLATLEVVAEAIGKQNKKLTATIFGAEGNTYSRNIDPATAIEGLSDGVDDLPMVHSDHRPDQILAYDVVTGDDLVGAINRKEITPLTIKMVDDFTKDKNLKLGIINSTGAVVEITYRRPLPNDSSDVSPAYHQVDISNQNDVCLGDAGTAVHILDTQGTPTGDIVGLISNMGSQFSFNNCSSLDYAVFMAFNKPNGVAAQYNKTS